MKLRNSVRLIGVLMALLVSGCGLSLAEDIKPPPNYREPVVEQAQPVAESTLFPLIPPDPAQGQLIYVEKCLPCHGETGMGDGPQAADLPNPAAQLGRSDLTRGVRPVDWFRIVTQGNIERFMPGFSSLNDRQRWDVVAYSLTLSSTPAELEEGKALYDQNCAACHGQTGLGDGPDAAGLAVKPASWFDQERLAGLSAAEMAAVMAGSLEGHPDLSGQLDENKRFAVAAYVRALSFSNPAQGDQSAASGAEESGEPGSTDQQSAPDSSDAQIPEKITISGKISNASPGGSVPSGMVVTISAFEEMTPAFNLSGEVAEDGTYTIEDVEYNQNFVYFAQVEANGLTFNSDILHGGDISGAQAELPLQIYDTTSDQSSLRTARLHVFLDFSVPGNVQVVNLFIVSNLGDKVVAPAEPDGPVIMFELPEGAQNLQFQDGELGGRFVETDQGFGDRMTVMPGASQHQILYAYELPYDRKQTIDLKVPLAVDAAIVMLPPTGVKLKSAQLVDAGQQDVQGMSYQMFQAAAGLPSGSSIRLELSGRVGVTGDEETSSVNYLLIGIGGFGVVLAGVGLWLYRIRSAAQPEEELEEEPVAAAPDTSDALIDAIVTLDDLHASGELPEAAYQERRADLKARLAEVMKNQP